MYDNIDNIVVVGIVFDQLSLKQLNTNTNNMKYVANIITKFWRNSIINGQDWLAKPLLKVLNSKWLKRFEKLPHKVLPYHRGLKLEFIFDLIETGDFSPNLLGSIFITIVEHPKVAIYNGNISIFITAYYEGDVKSMGSQFILTPSSTADEFIEHFLEFTNKVGHGESKVVLSKAQYVKAKVVSL